MARSLHSRSGDSRCPDAAARGRIGAAARSRSACSLSLRPGQWTKNLLVFAGLRVRASNCSSLPRSLRDRSRRSSIFCALSGVVYLVNDVMDRETDRRHPTEARRPIAAGDLPVSVALDGGRSSSARCRHRPQPSRSAGGSLPSRPAYLILQTLYSGPLKHIVIIDVLTHRDRVRPARHRRRCGHRRRHQPLAVRLHDSSGAVHRAGEAPARAGAARRRRRRAIARFSASIPRTSSIR